MVSKYILTPGITAVFILLILFAINSTPEKKMRSVRKTDEVELLILQSWIKALDIKNICSHHEQERAFDKILNFMKEML